jgi:hypothetical protein
VKQLWEPLPEPLHSFPNWVCYLLREQGLAESPTKQQTAVAQWMQEGPRKSLTIAYRGLGKSLLASYYALWRLRMDPQEKLLIVSATALKATDFTQFMLRTMGEVDVLNCLLPGPNNRFSNIAFDVAPATVEQSPSVRALGVQAQTTGQRCTCAILDDIEVLSNVITVLKQERVAHAVEEIESIIKPDEGQLLPRKVLYLGTPHTEASIYLRLVRERGYSRRSWPALYPDDIEPYEESLCPRIEAEVLADPALAGEPTDPERFSHEDLLQRQASMTKSTFQMQFMLNCRLATLDRYPIRLGDLVVMDIDASALPETVVWSSSPECRLQELVCVGLGADRFYHRPIFVNGWIPKSEHWRCVLAIDPAGRGSDEYSWSVVAELNGNMFVLESGGSTLGYSDEVMGHVAKVAKKWDVNYVVMESNFGDGMAASLLKPHLMREHAVTIEEVRHNIRKETRLCDTLGPIIQQHRLVITTKVIKQDYRMQDDDPENGYSRSLFFQASRLTPERGCLSHDDRLDSLAIGCAFFVESAAQDQLKSQQSRNEQLQRESLEAWMDETGAQVDALALGWRPRAATGRSHGGVTRLRVGA